MSTLILQKKREGYSFKQLFVSITTTIQLWLDKHAQRAELAKMDARQLKDIGITEFQAQQEISKPFWK